MNKVSQSHVQNVDICPIILLQRFSDISNYCNDIFFCVFFMSLLEVRPFWTLNIILNWEALLN